VPDKAVVYEHDGSAFVVERHLKVMLEKDYLALRNNLGNEKLGMKELPRDQAQELNDVSSQIVREIVLPAIEREVNEGKTFANLRQIYNSMILATWYKKNLRSGLLGRVYMDQNKVKGIDLEDKAVKERIYAQYLETFKKGVYNYIREDYDETTRRKVPRKYFSGGLGVGVVTEDKLEVLRGGLRALPESVSSAITRPESSRGEDRQVTIELVENAGEDVVDDVFGRIESSPIIKRSINSYIAQLEGYSLFIWSHNIKYKIRAAKYLGNHGRNNPKVVEALINTLKSREYQIVVAAVDALEELDELPSIPQERVDDLIGRLDNYYSSERWDEVVAMIEILGKLGSLRVVLRAVPVLRKTLFDHLSKVSSFSKKEQVSIRTALINVLLKLNDKKTVDLVIGKIGKEKERQEKLKAEAEIYSTPKLIDMLDHASDTIDTIMRLRYKNDITAIPALIRYAVEHHPGWKIEKVFIKIESDFYSGVCADAIDAVVDLMRFSSQSQLKQLVKELKQKVRTLEKKIRRVPQIGEREETYIGHSGEPIYAEIYTTRTYVTREYEDLRSQLDVYEEILRKFESQNIKFSSPIINSLMTNTLSEFSITSIIGALQENSLSRWFTDVQEYFLMIKDEKNDEIKLSSIYQELRQDRNKVGGIDFNPAALDLQIKRDGNGVALPLPQQPVGNMKIEGFLPVIINITPVNIPLLLGMSQKGPAEGAASTDSPQAPADIREKVYTGREENISWLN